MVRAPCCEKMGLKRGPWSPEEDQILVSYILQYGHGNWRALPKQAGLLRCGKSCRLRWTNYLRPDIKRGNFSREEEETIIELHKNLGNRWSAIAARLPGRTDNEIKNVWHTHIKKKLNCHSQNQPPRDSKSHSKSIIQNSNCDNEVSQNSNFSSTTSEQIVTTSPQHCSSEMSSVTDSSIEEKTTVKNEEMDYSSEYLTQIDESFWSDELTIEDIDLLSKGNEEKIELQTALSGEQNVEMDAILDDNMDFWYDLFVRAGEVPELPEF